MARKKPICSGGKKPCKPVRPRYSISGSSLYCGTMGKCNNEANATFYSDGKYEIVTKQSNGRDRKYNGRYVLHSDKITLKWSAPCFFFFRCRYKASFYLMEKEHILDPSDNLKFTGKNGILEFAEDHEIKKINPRKRRCRWIPWSRN